MYITKKYKHIFKHRLIIQELSYKTFGIIGQNFRFKIDFYEYYNITNSLAEFATWATPENKYLYIIKDKRPSKKIGFVFGRTPILFGVE